MTAVPGKNDSPSGPIGVAVLGSTGSVGQQTLDVIAGLPDRFRVVALAAGSNLPLLTTQAEQFRPDLIVSDEPPHDVALNNTQYLQGEEGLVALAEGMAKNKTLKKILLWGNKFTSFAAKEWQSELNRRKDVETDIVTYGVDDTVLVAKKYQL